MRLRRSLLLVLTAGALVAPTVTAGPAALAATPSGTLATLRTVDGARTSAYQGGNWAAADRVSSYVEADGDLGVVSVDVARGRLVVDTYTAGTYAPQGAAKTVSFGSWPLFGGVYTSPEGEHFLLTGRDNPQEDDDRQVVSVRRFAPDWTARGEARLTGGVSQGIKGIYVPFDASAADMQTVGGRLVVHMGRTMYATGDGVHHQADLTFEVDLATMRARSFEELGQAPYSSHSFRQLVTTVGDDLVLADHGDAYPRALQVSVVRDYPTARAVDTYDDVFPFAGEVGDNETGTELTGIAGGTSRALLTGVSVPHRRAVQGVTGAGSDLARNVFLISIDPTDGRRTFSWLTDLSPNGTPTALEPRITPVGADRFAVLFSVRRGDRLTQEYRLVDAAGAVLASRSWSDAYFSPVSDPVLAGDRLLWVGLDARVAPGSRATTFLFGLDLADPAAPVRLGSPTEVLDRDAALGRVKVSGGRLTGTFKPTVKKYRVEVRTRWSGVVGVPRYAGARVEYQLVGTGNTWTTQEFSVGFDKGTTATVLVRVTAEDGTARHTYTFVMKRPR